MSTARAVRERPILFSGSMIRALLAGTKTQTRRVITPQPPAFVQATPDRHPPRHPAPYLDSYCGEKKTEANPRGMSRDWCWWTRDDRPGGTVARCPYGIPGDRLWVRETWRSWEEVHVDEDDLDEPPTHQTYVAYAATPRDGYRPVPDKARITYLDASTPLESNPQLLGPWRPSIFMPRWASRITLEITDVRVQRVQEISEEDAEAEGCPGDHAADRDMDAVDQYRKLWDSINSKRASWASNPWVWALTLRRVS